jgi:hypothetical protein
MAASLNGEFKRLEAQIQALAEKLDNLTVDFRILQAHVDGIDKSGQPSMPKRAGYGGKTSTLKSRGA